MSLYLNGGFLGHTQRLTEPIAFVGGYTEAFIGQTGNRTISFTSLVGGLDTRPQKNDLVILCYATGSTANRNMANYVTGSGFTVHQDLIAVGATYDTNLGIYYKFMGDTPDTSITLIGGTSSTSDAGTVAVHVWRNVDPSNPLDVTTTTGSSTTSAAADPPAITPVSPGAFILVIGAGAHAQGTQYFASPEDAVTAFFTNGADDTNDITLGIGVYREWVSGSYNPVAFRFSSATTTGSNVSATMALRPIHPPSGSSGVWNVRAKYQDSMRYG